MERPMNTLGFIRPMEPDEQTAAIPMPNIPEPPGTIKVRKGDSLTIPILVQTPFDYPVNLTGYKIYGFIRERPDVQPLINQEITPQNPDGGAFFIKFTRENMALREGRYIIDVQLAHPLAGSYLRLTTIPMEILRNDQVVEDKILSPLIIKTGPHNHLLDVYGEIAALKVKMDNHIDNVPLGSNDHPGIVQGSESINIEDGVVSVRFVSNDQIAQLLDTYFPLTNLQEV